MFGSCATVEVMKLLLIAENWPPRVGGIEKYLTGLTGELAKRNEVTVVVPRNPDTFPDKGRWGGVSVIRKRFFWPFIKPSWLPLYIFIHRLAQREQFDAILCGKALFEGLVGYYLKKYLDIPYVVFTYGMEIAVWQDNSVTRRKLIRVLTHANQVIVINDITKQAIRELGVLEDRIVKIYPAVDEKFLEGLKQTAKHEAILEKYGIRKPYILTVARLIPRKGIDDLIRAYAKLDQTKFRNVSLVIVGDGPQRTELEKIAAQEYVQPKFLGIVSDEDLPALYANARLFALTPKEVAGDIEGFGIVYLEAAAAGLPIVATRTGGVPEAMLAIAANTLVKPGDISGIAQTLTAAMLLEQKHSMPSALSWNTQAEILRRIL